MGRFLHNALGSEERPELSNGIENEQRQNADEQSIGDGYEPPTLGEVGMVPGKVNLVELPDQTMGFWMGRDGKLCRLRLGGCLLGQPGYKIVCHGSVL